MGQKPFYITTAISYVNGAPHLGHAYEAILADVVARFHRLDGRDVKFLTGTDEHGEKVAKTAGKNGVSPKAFADMNAGLFQEMTQCLNITQDDFIRTTEPRHYAAAQALWEKLVARGDIYLDKYEGWYSIREEGYFSEDELAKDEKTGQYLTPNGTPVEWVEESSYFFKLSAYTERLLEHYKTHPEFIQPQSRFNEVVSFVSQGLRDLSVSRHKSRLDWGIPVPGDPDHVMYVWLDALTNYITAVGYPDMGGEFSTYWPADVHLIGKDITRFHAVYWPAFLMSAGIAPPRSIFAHGFINVQGEKMSKSVGNVVSPDALIQTYGVDQIRYVLMREIPHGQDGNFSPALAVQRINADLANAFGNLAQRTLSMIHKNCDAAIPTPGEFTAEDQALLDLAHAALPKIRDHMDHFLVHRALEDLWQVVYEANAYVDAQAPWALKKEDPARMVTVLYVLAETIRCLGIMIQPVTPAGAAKLLNQLNVPENDRFFSNISAAHILKPGLAILQPEGIFPRIMIEKEEGAAA